MTSKGKFQKYGTGFKTKLECHLADKTVNYPAGLCEGLEAASHQGPHGLVVVGQGRVNHRQLQNKGDGWLNREMGE
jgi:hypothetical protein